MSKRLSVRHLLTPEERKFCVNFSASSRKYPTESYRQAFKKECEGLSSNDISQKAMRLVKHQLIQAYLDELDEPVEHAARRVIEEQVKTAEGPTAIKAADKVLDQEEKLSAADATEYWARLMCEVGAEIEVPLPGACQNCGAPFKVSVPMADMFPQFKEGAEG